MKVKNTMFKWLFLLCLVILFGCSKTDDGSYIEPVTSIEKLMGTWKLAGIKEIDELAKAQQIKPEEIILSDKFNFSTMKITFSVDTTSGHKPTTFSVEGDAPKLFAQEGFWDMDTPYAKTDGTAPIVYIYSDEAKTILVDKFSVLNIPGKEKTLVLKLSRISDNVNFLSYEIAFKQPK